MASASGRPHSPHPDEGTLDPMTLYARALQAYTLRLWTESLKAVEERRASVAQKESGADLTVLKVKKKQSSTTSS